VHNLTEDELITNLLRNEATSLSLSGQRSIRTYLLHGMQTESDGNLRVWCFHYKVDGIIAAIWLLLALIVACACGLGVGYGKGDSQLGWSVGTGMLAVLTMINGLVVMCNV
jgi:hypothetical protein